MAIADALKVKLTLVPEGRTPSLQAYKAYLRYRSYQWEFTPEASQRSRECLEQALALDPGLRCRMLAWPITIWRSVWSAPWGTAGDAEGANSCSALSRSSRSCPKHTPCWASWPLSMISSGAKLNADFVWRQRANRCPLTCESGTRNGCLPLAVPKTPGGRMRGRSRRIRCARCDMTAPQWRALRPRSCDLLVRSQATRFRTTWHRVAPRQRRALAPLRTR